MNDHRGTQECKDLEETQRRELPHKQVSEEQQALSPISSAGGSGVGGGARLSRGGAMAGPQPLLSY